MTTIEAPQHADTGTGTDAPQTGTDSTTESPGSAAGPAAEPATADDGLNAAGVPVAELIARLDASETGQIVIPVDPNKIVFGPNIRPPGVTKTMIESVRQHGFVNVPSAIINADGQIQMLAGQRRILAAREVEYNPCPVNLRRLAGSTDTETAAEIIGAQWDENEARENMTAGHKLAAIESYLDLGISPNKVARKLSGVDAKEVLAVQALANSEQARRNAADGALTFTQAETLIEFEDTPREVEKLIKAAARSNAEFIRTAEEIRTERRRAAASADAAEPFRKRGYTVLEREPFHSEERQTRPISKLRTETGGPVTEADMAAKHWGVLMKRATRTVVAATGEVIDEDYIEHDPSAQLAKGMHHAADVTTEDHYTPEYYCLDKKAAGVVYHEYPNAPFETKAAKSAKNKRTQRFNELARNETTARRAFVSDWLAKALAAPTKNAQDLTKFKSLTKDAVLWRAHLEWADPEIFGDYGAATFAASLLGSSADKYGTENGFARVSVERASVIMIGRGMGAVEIRMQPDEKNPRYWRARENPHVFGYTVKTNVFVPYLQLLAKLGHDLGPVERYVTGDLTEEKFFAEVGREPASRR